MAIRYKQSINFWLTVVLGLGLAITFATNYVLDALQAWQDWAIILLCLSGLGIILAHLIVTYLIRPTIIRYAVKTQLMLVILSVAVSSLFLTVGWVKSRPISWIEATGLQPEQSATLFDQTAWDEHHSGFEVHATDNDDAQWMWHAYADLPETIKQFGGTLRLVVTQPEWAVFDEQGKVYQGGDGVEVRFVIERNGTQETAQQVTLNLHARPEQRHWQTVEVPVPAGSQRLSIEALPGPPGSNNWYDRVWVSVARTESLVDNVIRLADWLSIGLLIHVSCSAIVVLGHLLQGWEKMR